MVRYIDGPTFNSLVAHTYPSHTRIALLSTEKRYSGHQKAESCLFNTLEKYVMYVTKLMTSYLALVF